MQSSPSPFANALPPPPRSWWSRNWKWFVPTGCLTLFALVVAFIACIFFFVFGMMKSSDAYQGAVRQAKDDPRVIAALGTPITEGYFVSGHTNVDGASGTADLAIPLSGPKGKATVYVVAEKSAGQWTYSTLAVEIAGSRERIHLEPATPED